MEKKIFNKNNISNNALKRFYNSAIYILIFEIIYKGLLLLISGPIFQIIVSLFNKDGSNMVLFNQELSKNFLRYTGYIMIILVMILAVIFVFFELSFILLILDKSKKKDKISLLEITKTALLKLKSAMKNKNIGLIPYILISIPILNIGIQSSLYPLLSIAKWIINKFNKYPGGKILFTLVGLGAIYLLTKLFIVLPIMIFSDKHFKEAAKLSFKTIKSEGLKIAFLMIMVLLIWLILSYPPFMILEAIQFILPPILRNSNTILMTLFTLAAFPFILSISLEYYNFYVRSGYLNKEEIDEGILEVEQNQIWKDRNYQKIFIFVILVLIIGFSIYSDESVAPIFDNQLLIGHRGGDYGVENTIDTILYAGNNGADYVEIDVLLTKDNVPVVIHDNSLKRLADTGKKIGDLTIAEVKDITIKDKDNKDEIPLLEELAKEVKGQIELLVEFKTHGKEKESIVDKSIEILEKEGILKDTIFQTAEYEIIKEFNENYKDLSIGYIYKGRIGIFPVRRLSKMSVDFISVKESLINKRMIRKLHKSGKAVFTWTTNKDQKAETLLKLGVDGIITDYSVEKVEIRDKYDDYNEK